MRKKAVRLICDTCGIHYRYSPDWPMFYEGRVCNDQSIDPAHPCPGVLIRNE